MSTVSAPRPQDVVAIIGLGYVGLPLALEFGKIFDTIGFDISKQKVSDSAQAIDPTGETRPEQFADARHITFTHKPEDLARADVIIVAVPTPVDGSNRPDFSPLVGASRTIGAHLKPGAIVCYESTVYPGATEEICVPELEKVSGKKWKQDFFIGYSPERINPGDKVHTLPNIIKVVAGDTPETSKKLEQIYGTVVKAGIHLASSIQVAEAAKVIENTQRDLNIALMNELALIFDRLGIDTLEVLKAAGTKWNFLPFRPGLVGGHCIGVDPYYLTAKAQMVGYSPQVILAGRRINDAMGPYVARQTIKKMITTGKAVGGCSITVLGFTFKENVPDVRNSRVVDVVKELESFGVKVYVHDPVASKEETLHEYGVTLTDWDDIPATDAVIAAVNHDAYLQMPLAKLTSKCNAAGIFVDVKGAFDQRALEEQGLSVWRL
ncbi:MAG: nucleotide sugar dehydrogenase [Burkholderiaceae bacterium]